MTTKKTLVRLYNSYTKKFIGKLLVWGSFSLMMLLAIIQYLKVNENINFGVGSID